MKKSKFSVFLYVLSVAVLFSLLSVCGLAAEEERDFSRDENYAILISNGCPEEALKNLTDSAFSKLNEEIGEHSVGDVEFTPDYIIYKDGKNADYVKCDVLKIGLNNKATGDFEGIAMCVKWELENKPFIKDNDYITFAWNDATTAVPYKFICGEDSFYAEDLSEDGLTVNTYNSPAYADFNEIGHYTDISKASGGIAVFELCGTSTENVKDLSELYFRVDYVHKTETLETAFAIGFPLLFVAAVVFLVVILRRRRKNAQ